MVKKVLLGVLLCACVFWSCRIYSINRVGEDVRYYTMQDTIDYDGVQVQPQEAHLYTQEEYCNRFGVSMDDLMELNVFEGKNICVCLRFTNQTGEDISWDTLMNNAGEGFESTTWSSANMPGIGQNMNIFHSETFKPGAVQDVWFTTNVAKICFKPKNWQRIQEYPFYYVLSLKPEKIKIKLDIGEGA